MIKITYKILVVVIALTDTTAMVDASYKKKFSLTVSVTWVILNCISIDIIIYRINVNTHSELVSVESPQQLVGVVIVVYLEKVKLYEKKKFNDEGSFRHA